MRSTVEQPQYANYCFFCGTPACGEHHLLFGRGIRKLADDDGLKVHVCNSCHTMGDLSSRIHDNPMAEKLSKMLGQAMYERNRAAEGMSVDDAREIFRKRYGFSFW